MDIADMKHFNKSQGGILKGKEILFSRFFRICQTKSIAVWRLTSFVLFIMLQG